jgi:hypothetical protein
MRNDNNSYDIQTIRTVDDMRIVASDIVTNYCNRHNIDENDIFPSIWADIITELNALLFGPCNRVLKTDSNLNNEYDKRKVEYVYNNIYKRLCNSHCQEVTIKGFIDMSGIGKQTLYDWQINSGLSSSGSDLVKKIAEDNEESLFNLMKDRRLNPMKVLPKLNRYHGWNMPGARAERTEREALGADALIQLGQQPKPLELSDNSTMNDSDN